MSTTVKAETDHPSIIVLPDGRRASVDQLIAEARQQRSVVLGRLIGHLFAQAARMALSLIGPAFGWKRHALHAASTRLVEGTATGSFEAWKTVRSAPAETTHRRGTWSYRTDGALGHVAGEPAVAAIEAETSVRPKKDRSLAA
jgi:hypothetical protein